jgi:hypothetical protein
VRVHPPVPKTQAALDRMVATFKRLGADPHAGDNLGACFLGAGLPSPDCTVGPPLIGAWTVRST